MILNAATVVTGTDVFSPGWVEIDGEQVRAVGYGWALSRVPWEAQRLEPPRPER